jgi:hypothetical protein
VSKEVPEELALIGLLHDASEAYLSDIARPVKYTEPILSVYKAAEEKLEACIAEKFHLEYPYPPEVKEADIRVGMAESRDLMPDGFPYQSWGGGVFDALERRIEPWGPDKAERKFLERYEALAAL